MNTTITEADDLARLRLLQLVSPALPVGAYAYSQGLEQAVECGWVHDEATARDWVYGLLEYSLTCLDAPVLARLYGAWSVGDAASVQYWNNYLYASRETREWRLEDRQLGIALARLLADLELNEAQVWRQAERVCFATLFALAAVRWNIQLEAAMSGYLWAWCENQVMAATKLVPLGQTAAQRLLVQAIPVIHRCAVRGLALDDEEIGACLPCAALAGSWHETQYSRLFRS